jgi:hypothetical protein
MVDGRSLDLLSLLLGGSRGDSRPIFEDRSHPTEVMCDVWLGLVLKPSSVCFTDTVRQVDSEYLYADQQSLVVVCFVVALLLCIRKNVLTPKDASGKKLRKIPSFFPFP